LEVSILLIEAGIFIHPNKIGFSVKAPSGFNPLNRGGDIHTGIRGIWNNSIVIVSILLIEAGIFIPAANVPPTPVSMTFQSS